MLDFKPTGDFMKAIRIAIARVKSEGKIVHLEPEIFSGFYISREDQLPEECTNKVIAKFDDTEVSMKFVLVCETLTGVPKK